MKFFYYIIIIFFVVYSLYSQPPESNFQNQFNEAIEKSHNPDPYIRRQAAEQFGILRDVRAIPHLKRLLKDENPFVRQASVDSLGLLRAKEVIDDILDVLKNDNDLQVRQSAIIALGYIGISDFKVVSPLIDILKNEKESYALKYAACNTLSILRSTQAVSVLVELLESTEDINLKKSIIYTLGKISHPDGISALRDSIEKNLQNEAIIADIVKVLVEVSDVGVINKFKVLYSTPTISLKTKFYFAYALAKLAKDTSVLGTIKNSLKSPDEGIKNLAIDAIRFIGDKESLSMLKEMYKKETSVYTKQLLDIAIKQLEMKYPSSLPETPQKKR
ncbi:MAG: HEAT repeat domain-containing protein [Endomicrobia bacterium]|nr:HEAT repeat domain-containing protein [Endomicrobiia bacterium]